MLIFAAAQTVSALSQQEEQADDGKIKVTTVIFAPYDFVREIAGDKVHLTMLLRPGAESHSYEPSPQDIITIQNSDVFIYTGGENDVWVDRILGSMDTSGMKIIRMMDSVKLVEEEIVEGMEDADHNHEGHDHEEEEAEDHEGHDHEVHDHEEIVYDEHVWTSPANAALIVSAISGALCEADPANAALYRQNTTAYQAKLAQLDAAFSSITFSAKRRIVVFGDRFPFRYFTDRYGLEYYAAFPGCSTETEPSAATVAFLIDKIRAEHIPVVFHIELSNERMANTIASETGAKKLLLHSCHNLSKADFDKGASYLSLMNRNVEALREALN